MVRRHVSRPTPCGGKRPSTAETAWSGFCVGSRQNASTAPNRHITPGWVEHVSKNHARPCSTRVSPFIPGHSTRRVSQGYLTRYCTVDQCSVRIGGSIACTFCDEKRYVMHQKRSTVQLLGSQSSPPSTPHLVSHQPLRIVRRVGRRGVASNGFRTHVS